MSNYNNFAINVYSAGYSSELQLRQILCFGKNDPLPIFCKNMGTLFLDFQTEEMC